MLKLFEIFVYRNYKINELENKVDAKLDKHQEA